MRKYIGMFLLLLIGFFSETGKADEEPYTELSGESIVTNVDESNAADSTTGYAQYDVILEEYSDGFRAGWDAAAFSENGLCYLAGWEAPSDVGYYLIDLDQNGMEELLIGIIGEKGFFYDLYTIQDNQSVLIARSGERDRYYLCMDNIIANEGSGSAFTSGWVYYYLEGSHLQMKESVVYDGYYSEAEPWYYSTDSERGDYSTPITEEYANSVRDLYKYMDIPYISLNSTEKKISYSSLAGKTYEHDDGTILYSMTFLSQEEGIIAEMGTFSSGGSGTGMIGFHINLEDGREVYTGVQQVVAGMGVVEEENTVSIRLNPDAIFVSWKDINGRTIVEADFLYVGDAQIPLDSANNDFILPDSNVVRLTQQQLYDMGLDSQQLRLARNEIFARHGRTFDSVELQQYFDSKSWYVPQYSPEEFEEIQFDILNDIEWDNIALISDMEGQADSLEADMDTQQTENLSKEEVLEKLWGHYQETDPDVIKDIDVMDADDNTYMANIYCKVPNNPDEMLQRVYELYIDAKTGWVTGTNVIAQNAIESFSLTYGIEDIPEIGVSDWLNTNQLYQGIDLDGDGIGDNICLHTSGGAYPMNAFFTVNGEESFVFPEANYSASFRIISLKNRKKIIYASAEDFDMHSSSEVLLYSSGNQLIPAINFSQALDSVYFGRKDQSSRSIRPPFTEKMITFHGGIDHLSRRGDHPQSFSL